MDLSEISNLTLYQLINNNELPEEIRQQANSEFTKRNLSKDEIKNIVLEYEKEYSANKMNSSISLTRKILLVLLPFQPVIQMLFLKEKHIKDTQKDFWNYIGLGFLFWTIIVILIAKYAHSLEVPIK